MCLLIRFAAPLIAIALSVTQASVVTAQTYTEAEQAAMAQIEAEQPMVYTMKVATGRFDDMIQTHGFRLETMSETFFGDRDPALWEAQNAEGLATDRLILDFAAEVADIRLTKEIIPFSGDFEASDLGQRLQIIETEIGQNRLRVAAQFDVALAAFREIEGTDDPRALLILRMEEVSPKVEFLLNRTQAEEFAFRSGPRAEGYYLNEMSDDDMRDRIDYDREAMRPQALEYYNVLRMMMCDTLTLDEMTAYIDAFDSAPGGSSINSPPMARTRRTGLSGSKRAASWHPFGRPRTKLRPKRRSKPAPRSVGCKAARHWLLDNNPPLTHLAASITAGIPARGGDIVIITLARVRCPRWGKTPRTLALPGPQDAGIKGRHNVRCHKDRRQAI